MPKDDDSVVVVGADEITAASAIAMAIAMALAARRGRTRTEHAVIDVSTPMAPGPERVEPVDHIVIEDHPPGSREAKRDERYPNYQCAVRAHVTYRAIDGKARVTTKWNGRAPARVKHGAANTHPGKRGKRLGYRHVSR